MGHYRAISLILIIHLSQVMSLVCYCENHCPNYGDFNGTCVVSANAYCFSSVELKFDLVQETWFEYRSYGCLGADEQGLMQCRGYLTKFHTPKNISCCRESDSCNEKLLPQLYVNYNELELPEGAKYYSTPDSLTVTISAIIVAGLLLTAIAALYRRLRNHPKKDCLCTELVDQEKTCHYPLNVNSFDVCMDSSGSGRGAPRFVQQTIGKQIQLLDNIGEGRFGQVHYALWRGEQIAVKVFSTTDEASWQREREIYQTVLLRHEHVLGFVAADIIPLNSCTRMILVTDYHELGSLYDYLHNNTLDYSALLKIARSAISGICHLHTEIYGIKGKPGIAHRDIKSKNILVKKNNECCIADFGLAAKYNRNEDALDFAVNKKVGTIRYMSPESLSESTKMDFECLKCADVYSYSLVLWEICTRCESKAVAAQEYHPPYHTYVSPNPSMETMKEVVLDKGIRPEVPENWEIDPILSIIFGNMRESWSPNYKARPTALRLKKTFMKLEKETFSNDSNIYYNY